jgi:hypothetical protein
MIERKEKPGAARNQPKNQTRQTSTPEQKNKITTPQSISDHFPSSHFPHLPFLSTKPLGNQELNR